MSDALEVRPLEQPPNHVIELPGSKSITNRALLIAALAMGESRLVGALDADDTRAMLGCIEALGAAVHVEPTTRDVVVTGTGGAPREGPVDLDARQSGTTGRFVAAAALAGRGRYRVDGDPQLRARPVADLVAALGSLGAVVSTTEGAMPLTIDVDGRHPGGAVDLDASRSSQFGSALLMVGPLLEGGLTLRLVGEVVSQPYLDMTVAVMTAFGATVNRSGQQYRVEQGDYVGRTYDIEPDASAASYFFGAAVLAGGTITVPRLTRRSLQGDVAFVDVLEQMGAVVDATTESLSVTSAPLAGVDVDLRHISDTVPTLAVVAAAATTPTTMRGIEFIRGKESDRIQVVVDELNRLGVAAAAVPAGLRIEPGPHHSARVETHDDHRIAMAFALLGLRGPAIEIAEPGCVAKTFPDYFEVLDRLRSPADRADRASRPQGEPAVANADIVVIAIDGPAGSGKSTVARAVADRVGLEYLDTGAMYRAVTFAAICRGIDPADDDDVAEVARQMDLVVDADGVRVDGVDATTEIRGPEVTRAVSVVAANPEVRKELRSRQREWARRRGGGVMEGRDIGTVVFPDARLKVYLTASPEVRAGRRAQEVTDLDYETVAADIARRDALDQGRDDSPLVEAADAITVDTSDMSIDQVVDAVEQALR